jgi:hypothetical protein
VNEFKDLFGKEERHRRLHGRLLAVLVLSLILDFVLTLVLYQWGEKHTTTEGVGKDLFKAFIYTTEQIVTGGSTFMISTKGWWEHAIEGFLDIYMVTVIAAVAGSFASFFTATSQASSSPPAPASPATGE